MDSERPDADRSAARTAVASAHRQFPYAAGLDGLRAIAVLAVILYHAGLGWLPGGFLGVEIFFVISGYLITSLLLGEWESRGSISLKAFWLRRARRLLPAVFLTLVVTLAYALFFLPDQVTSLRKDVLAAAFYVSNWYLILDHKSYFETMGRPSLLRHLWSLAVEEQFYVFWPLFLTIALRRLRRPAVLGIAIGIATASTALMALLYLPDADPSRVYYGTDTRATGLLAGAALAFVWRPWLDSSRFRAFRSPVLDLGGLAALVALLGFCATLGEYQPFLYRGGFAVVSLVTLGAIAATVHPNARLGRWFLGRQPLRWIGLRSYSIYLWHWPIFTVTRPQLDVPLDGLPLLALRLALTALFAELSYRLVETPIRSGALGRAWQSLRRAEGGDRRRLTIRYGGSVAALALVIASLGTAAASARPPEVPDYQVLGSVRTFGNSALAASASGAPVAAAAEPVVAGATAEAGVPEPGAQAAVDPLATPAEPTATPLEPAAVDGQSAETSASAEMTAAPTSTVPVPAVQSPAPAAQPAPAAVSTQAGRATLIGDSVVLSAWAAVHQVPGLEVDGKVNRQASEAIEVMRADRDEGFLGSTVLVHIGSNGPFSAAEFDEMMRVLGSERRVIFMTVRVPRQWEAANNAVIVDGVKRYANCELLDWSAASAGHPGWFRDDGVHTSGDGAKAYASLIAQAIGR